MDTQTTENEMTPEDESALDAAEAMEARSGKIRLRERKLFAVLPTLLTLSNAACGFGAITFAAKVGPFQGVESELWISAALIYAAMVFDMFDGSAARWANQTSEFGALLDSLCDAISFGVAPAFLMLQFTKYKHIREMELNVEPFFNYPDKILWMIGALFMLCVILRLARFNVETDDDDSHAFFSGLPSPAGAGVIASFPIVIWGLRDMAADQEFFGHSIAMWLVPAIKFTLPVVTLIVAFLMVSRIRYPHFFNQLFSGRRSRKHLIQILVAIVFLVLMPGAVLFLMFAYFAFGAPLQSAWFRVTKRKPAEST